MIKRDLQKELGINLQKARTKRNLTREELAEMAGISPTFLANLECGNKMMSVVTLRNLADGLCVSSDTLLYGESTCNQMRNIEILLRNQSEEMIKFIEELTHLSVTRIPAITSEGKDSGDSCEEVPDDVGT